LASDRTHYGIAKDTPIPRAIQAKPVNSGKVVALPRVGGLHHRYEWREAAWVNCYFPDLQLLCRLFCPATGM